MGLFMGKVGTFSFIRGVKLGLFTERLDFSVQSKNKANLDNCFLKMISDTKK